MGFTSACVRLVLAGSLVAKTQQIKVAASGSSARARIKIYRAHPVKSKLDQLAMLK